MTVYIPVDNQSTELIARNSKEALAIESELKKKGITFRKKYARNGHRKSGRGQHFIHHGGRP